MLMWCTLLALVESSLWNCRWSEVAAWLHHFTPIRISCLPCICLLFVILPWWPIFGGKLLRPSLIWNDRLAQKLTPGDTRRGFVERTCFLCTPRQKKTKIATALYVAEGGIVSVGVEKCRDALCICGIYGGGWDWNGQLYKVNVTAVTMKIGLGRRRIACFYFATTMASILHSMGDISVWREQFEYEFAKGLMSIQEYILSLVAARLNNINQSVKLKK